MVATFDFGQGTDKTFHLLRAVADRNIGEDIADIAELDLNVVLVPQDVVDLNACKADIQRGR